MQHPTALRAATERAPADILLDWLCESPQYPHSRCTPVGLCRITGLSAAQIIDALSALVGSGKVRLRRACLCRTARCLHDPATQLPYLRANVAVIDHLASMHWTCWTEPPDTPEELDLMLECDDERAALRSILGGREWLVLEVTR